MWPATTTPSVLQLPTLKPAAVAIAASSRVVVVLPLLPVTSSVGTSCSVAHGTSSGNGSAARGQQRLPLPAPSDKVSSSSNTGTPRRRAAAFKRASGAACSALARVRNRLITASAWAPSGCVVCTP